MLPSPSSPPSQTLGDKKYASSKFEEARRLLAGTVQGREYDDFLTSLCYDHILTRQGFAKM